MELIGIGPSARFISTATGSCRSLYIATEDAQLILLRDITRENMNIEALLEMDLISRILCLSDCTTNETNCGMKGVQPVIIDFRIAMREQYSKDDIWERFVGGNSEYNYLKLMSEAAQADEGIKRQVATKALNKWSLRDKIQIAENWARDFESDNPQIVFENDLKTYTKDILATIDCLNKKLSI